MTPFAKSLLRWVEPAMLSANFAVIGFRIGYFVYIWHLVFAAWGIAVGVLSVVLFPVTFIAVPIVWAFRGSFLPLGLMVLFVAADWICTMVFLLVARVLSRLNESHGNPLFSD